MNVIKSIERLAANEPKRLAFINRDAAITYEDLWSKSNRLASYVENYSEKQHSPIIVYGHMAPEMVVSFLGSVKAGHPYIPVDVSIPIDRIKKIMDSSKAEFFFATEEIEVDHFENYPIKMVQSEELLHILSSHDDAASEEKWVQEEDTFYIIYTSGSTGNPKGVQITANNLQSYVGWMLSDFPIDKQKVFLNQAPFSFDLSVMDLYPSLCTGGTLFAITKDMIANPKLLFEELKGSNIQVWTSTPSFAQMCLMEPGFSEEMLPGLEVFLFCGEVLSADIARQLKERFPGAKVFNLYGPTEATVAITMVEVTNELLASHSILPIGYSKGDTQLWIVDENGNQLPEGEKGEMIIVGPSVSKGYLGEKELTDKSFFETDGERAYRTGDAGYRKNGLLYYQGRLDFQVKVHGYRMELEEIEYSIAKSQYVEACVVVPVYKDGKIDYLSTFIVPAQHSFEKQYQLTAAIKKELSELLPSYMIPRKFSYTHSLPITPNGKVDRKKLSAEVMV
ncbi:D-alanine--poly(phosphoribitol) ligase subunit DltA [Heyndrickxia camelliae]|uniref:D-alanine--D-alanyl carrier protein ligase n=1 Tax=Heyndrickxia camelliae TaxID=1707093 RepID=A0A2N3LJH4_9BACI|nr:D-alanine--poly(phosphoribitol) ligase subunit DltA [Heyndrickxia camelliae]PKR84778.1 D-alanine--poly(phosphoribitol) ligase subunit 1 [Heyndrickxia camelliae]